MQLEDDKLTLDGFLRLNELELQDEESDEEEFWLTLSSWGFNRALQQDEVCALTLLRPRLAVARCCARSAGVSVPRGSVRAGLQR